MHKHDSIMQTAVVTSSKLIIYYTSLSSYNLLVCDVANVNSSCFPGRVHSAGSIDSVTKEAVARKFRAYDTSHYWTRVDANHELHVNMVTYISLRMSTSLFTRVGMRTD